MYSISLPPREFEPQSDSSPDTKSSFTANQELKLVRPSEPFPEAGAPQEQSNKAETLAAKILHLHAAADVAETKKPRLIDNYDEPALDVPGVLWRAKDDVDAVLPRPEVLALSDSGTASSGSLRNGPSFKALLISSLLIVAVGSGALAVSMTGLLKDRGDGSRTVETQSITAEPTIESLIAGSDGVSSGGGTAGEPAAGEIDAAKAQAKAQIRKVFAARDPNASASVNQAVAVADTAQNSSADKIQERLEPRRTGGAESALSNAGGTGSALAQPEQPASSDASTARQPAVAGLEPAQSGQTGAAAPAAGEISTGSEQSETGIGTLPVDPAYSNTGLVSVAVNLRQTADNDAEVLTVVPENSEVRFSKCGPWWCNISYEGQSGFISQKYLQR